MDVDLDDVQGLVRSGYRQLHAARFVLLRFTNAPAARTWLAGLRVTTAAPPAGGAPNRAGSAVNIAFTCQGLRALGVDEAVLAGFSLEFCEGMDTEHRARLLGDEGPSGRERWRWGRADDAHPLHAILLLYGEREVDAVYAEQRHAYQAAAEEVVTPIDTRFLTLDPGAADAPLLEHFGFRDGLSQPTLPIEEATGADVADERPLAMGEFLLGYRNEFGEIARGPILPTAADPGGILQRVGASAGADLGRNGSYLVARQLRQDVREFWQFVHRASGGSAAAREELAAKMVGRWRDGGRPLADGAVGLNRFGFAQDPDGVRCPLGAHVRRSNPRDWIPGRSPQQAIVQTRRHRLLRRGRPYGEPLHPTWDIDAILRSEGSDAERGLVFLCLNADLARQFEFVQSTWVMSPKFAGLESDADPLAGPRPRTMTIRSAGGRRRLRGMPRFVDLRGGAYFFLPGMRALRWLAALGQ